MVLRGFSMFSWPALCSDRWMEQVQILHTKKPNRAGVRHIEVFVQEQKYLEG